MKNVLKATAVTLTILGCAVFCACGGESQVIGQPRVPDSAALRAAAGKRVLVVISAHPQFGQHPEKTGYWLSEVTHFYHVLTRHGFTVDVVSPGGKPGVMDPSSDDMDDSLNKTFWDNAELRAKLERPLAPEQIKPAEYAVIYYAGGHGTMWDFPDSEPLARLAATIYEQGGIVSAVCHGPAGLLNIKLSNGEYLIKGRKLTGFANFEETLNGKKNMVPYMLEDTLKERGGDYSKAFFPFAPHAVVDGRLVTGQNPSSATPVAEGVIAVLEGLASGSVSR